MKDIYESKDEVYYFRQVRQDLISILPNNTSQKILEIGSGGGNTLVEIKKNNLASITYRCVLSSKIHEETMGRCAGFEPVTNVLKSEDSRRFCTLSLAISCAPSVNGCHQGHPVCRAATALQLLILSPPMPMR